MLMMVMLRTSQTVSIVFQKWWAGRGLDSYREKYAVGDRGTALCGALQQRGGEGGSDARLKRYSNCYATRTRSIQLPMEVVLAEDVSAPSARKEKARMFHE